MIHALLEGRSSSPHPNSPSMQSEEQAFRQAYPAFESTSILDHLRATEYTRLDELEHTYLDYTGGGLYADLQLREHFELLRHHVFGNPHSQSPTSRAITELDEQARAFVLTFFQASPDEYTVIFTANATHALKLVGEAYPFRPGGQFLILADNHNSVNGIREFARAKGAYSRTCPSSRQNCVEMRPFSFHSLSTRGTTLIVCLPILPSRTSRASSIHWNGSQRPTPEGGMCSWMRLASYPPIAWISPDGTPTLSRSRSTRCSAIRQG